MTGELPPSVNSSTRPSSPGSILRTDLPWKLSSALITQLPSVSRNSRISCGLALTRVGGIWAENGRAISFSLKLRRDSGLFTTGVSVRESSWVA